MRVAAFWFVTAALPADLKVIDLQPSGSNNTWRIRWNSVPGTDYQVQRAKDDQLSAVGTNGWIPILTVRATNTVTSAEDSGGANLRQRFYRVVQLARELSLRILDLKLVGATNVWRLRWNSIPGTDYQVQRAKDDQLQSVLTNGWVPVLSVRASGEVTSADDAAGPGVRQRFYRVVQLTNEQSLVVSPIDPGGSGGGGGSGNTIRIITGGTQTVSSVVFFDEGNLVDDGVPGIDGSWSLNLTDNISQPRIRQITARVTTVEGTVVDTPAVSFLEADTSKFVPLNEDGSPGYGSFVNVEPDGSLGRFLFYPEGLGDAARMTGAHIEFGAGARLKTLIGSVGIEFASAKFFRGHIDPAPLVASTGLHTLDIGSVGHDEVESIFGTGSPLALLWNGIPLEWRGGDLTENGWAMLFIRPPFSDFLLPETQECSLVSFDLKTGDPMLILCYHGDWAPFDKGPQFRIPRAEPLKVYLSWSGKVAAHGTVEATFPDGATLRGSVAWREPNFEVRFQGRNIVIPALASLKRALPADPELCLPTGNSAAELDAAAQCLVSIRDAYRALAMGGVAEVGLNAGDALAPLGEPVDAVGVALGAWAARLTSWAADRAGQTLDAEMITDLQKVVLNAATTGESAHDLPSVLKLLRDVMVLRQNRDTPLGNGGAANELRASIDDAESRLLAAAERVIEATGGFEASPEFAEVVRLLGSAAAAESPAGAGLRAAGGGSSRLQQVIAAAKAKIGPKFGGRVVLAANNQGLATLSSRELIGFLEELAVYRELITLSGGSIPTGAPTLQQVIQAAQNIRGPFAARSDEAAGAANTPADYFKLRDVLQERTTFFVLNDRLGLRLSSNDGGFFFQTGGLIQNLAEQFKSLPVAGKARACRDLEFVSALIAHTADNGAGASIAEADALVQNCNALTADALATASKAGRCDDLAQELMKAGFTIARRDPVQEGAAFPDVTGLYESVENGTESYVTLQLNQGGRYLQGGMQLQVQDSESRSARYIMWNLRGLFLRQTSQPGVMEFAVRLVNVVDGETKFALGTSQPDGQGGVTIQIGSVVFAQRSPNGRFSEPILSAFESGQRRSITASQQTPMHTRITARTITDASNLRLALDQYFSDSAGQQAEQEAAAEIQNKLDRIDRRLTVGQRPIAAALIRRVLSTTTPKTVKKSKLTGNVTDLGNKTMLYWDLLLAMSIRQNLNLAPQLGMTSSQFQELQSTLGADNFRYELVVQQDSTTIGEAFLTFGGGELVVTVKKFSAGGQLLDTFELFGFVGSWSPGVGIPLPLSCAITTNTYTFDSPLNFESADFAGPVDFAQFGVNIALPPGPIAAQMDLMKQLAGIDPSINSWQVGYFSVYGSGRFPAMTFKTVPIDGFQVNGCHANVGVGVDVGGGKLVSADPPDEQSILFNPGQTISFDASANPDLSGGVFFEINGSTLTDCGWQFLRTFVAEHHELLVGAKSKIRVEGHTDAPGSGAYNQQLSEARANSVRNALVGLMGASLRAPITATGFGETLHDQLLGIGSEAFAPNDQLFRRADIIVGGVVKATLGAPVTPLP